MPLRAVLHTGAVAFVVSAAAIVWRARLATDVLGRAWRLVRPAVGALAALTVGACLLLAAALIAGHSVMAASMQAIDPGLVGGVALFIAWLGYLPAALMWVLSFATGAGVQVAGVTVTPTTALTEPIGLVGLDLLPMTTQVWWLAGMVVPVAAGVVLSRLAGPASSAWRWLVPRATALAVVLIAVDLWWAVSVGRLGEGRLELLGPPPVVIAFLLAAVVVGILAECLVGWGWHRWRARDVVDLTQDTADSEDSEEIPA
jgi:hypothetical protein